MIPVSESIAAEEATSAVAPRPEGARIGRADLIAALACTVVCLPLFVLPHLLGWLAEGDGTWISDPDDLLYLGVASQAYFEHPARLSEPVANDGRPSIYPWLQMVPGILAARAAGLGPAGILLAWRLIAALTIPAALYALCRQSLRGRALAAALTVAVLADIGVTSGRPLLEQGKALVQLLRTGSAGWLDGGFRYIGQQWRVVTPGTVLALFLLHLTLAIRARREPSWPRIVASGVSFGVLFYCYFYYWTAAGLGLLLGALLDAGRRRASFHAGWIGGLVGLPAVIAGAWFKAACPPEAFERIDTFLKVERLQYVFLSRLDTALLAACLAWVVARRRDLLPMAFVAAAGWLLVNHQVVTGLQIQNFHYRNQVSQPLVGLMLALLVAPALDRAWGRSRLARWAVLAGCALWLAAGTGLRAMETIRAASARERMAEYGRYRDQRHAPDAPRLSPGAIVAGAKDFVDLAVILDDQRMLYSQYATEHCVSVGDEELRLRMALNGYLLVGDREAFAARQRWALDHWWWGPLARTPALQGAELRAQLASYDRVASDPEAALDRFGVRYVALPAGQEPPPSLGSGWRRIEGGPTWQVWERVEAAR